MNLILRVGFILLFVVNVSLITKAAPSCGCPYKMPNHLQPSEKSCLLGHLIQILTHLVTDCEPISCTQDESNKRKLTSDNQSADECYLSHLVSDVMREVNSNHNKQIEKCEETPDQHATTICEPHEEHKIEGIQAECTVTEEDNSPKESHKQEEPFSSCSKEDTDPSKSTKEHNPPVKEDVDDFPPVVFIPVSRETGDTVFVPTVQNTDRPEDNTFRTSNSKESPENPKKEETETKEDEGDSSSSSEETTEKPDVSESDSQSSDISNSRDRSEKSESSSSTSERDDSSSESESDENPEIVEDDTSTSQTEPPDESSLATSIIESTNSNSKILESDSATVGSFSHSQETSEELSNSTEETTSNSFSKSEESTESPEESEESNGSPEASESSKEVIVVNTTEIPETESEDEQSSEQSTDSPENSEEHNTEPEPAVERQVIKVADPVLNSQECHVKPPTLLPDIDTISESESSESSDESRSEEHKPGSEAKCVGEPETFFIPVLKFHGAQCLTAEELRKFLFGVHFKCFDKEKPSCT